MNTGRSIVIASLFLSWAILLAARVIAAATYASVPSRSYGFALDHIGLILPGFAWLCFAVATLLLIKELTSPAQPLPPANP
jgi:hypothetical protein